MLPQLQTAAPSSLAAGWLTEALASVPELARDISGRLRKASVERSIRLPADSQHGDGALDARQCLDHILQRRLGPATDIFAFADIHQGSSRKWLVFKDGSALCMTRSGEAKALTRDEFSGAIERIGALCERHGHWCGGIDEVRQGLASGGPKLSPRKLVDALDAWCGLRPERGFRDGLSDFSDYVVALAKAKLGLDSENDGFRPAKARRPA